MSARDLPELEPGAAAALDQALLAWRAGGLPCGASLVDADGKLVVVGRNRAYDEPTGTSVLEGTPLAHAELNVLAQVPTDRDLSGDTLWSTQRPCPMCESAITFCGVGAVRHLADDPSSTDLVADPGLTAWGLIANAVFLQPFISRGLEDTLGRNRVTEPETVALAERLASGGAPGDLDDLLALVRADLDGLLEQRRQRSSTAGS